MQVAHFVELDTSNVHSLTQAEMLCRRRVLEEVESHCDARLAKLASAPIVSRDCRKVIGRVAVSMQDVSAARGSSQSVGKLPALMSGGLPLVGGSGRTFDVPFDCLVPSGIESLLVAGRAVAGDRAVHAFTQSVMACAITGQAAGAAAAVSSRSGTLISALPMEEVQQELRAQGVCIGRSRKLSKL
jgi:hypothetical protein